MKFEVVVAPYSCRQAPNVQRNILPMPSSLLKVETTGVNKLMILVVKLHCIRSHNTSFEGIYGL